MINDKDIKKLSEIFATKDEILSGQDEILGKLETLLQEKTIGDEQDKRKKKAFQIHHGALKRGKILSAQEAVEIDKLHVF